LFFATPFVSLLPIVANLAAQQDPFFMKLLCFALLLPISILVMQCREAHTSSAHELKSINNLLDSFNLAAARADYKRYFDCFTEDAIFIRTDAGENWHKKRFMKMG
jgi:hypothetical protein